MSEFDDMMNTDPLLAAERITGLSYKEDSETLKLGMLLTARLADKKEDELSIRNDTHMRISFDEAIEIFKDLGFEEIYSEAFDYTSPFQESREEFFKIFWRNDGLLLFVDSYANSTSEDGVRNYSMNSANVYYNWVPNDVEGSFLYTSSGGFSIFRDGERIPTREEPIDGDNWVWTGNHDARQGIRHNIARLEDNGTFLAQWKIQPFLWLLNIEEQGNDDNYKGINERKIAQFPKHVQDAINAPRR